MEWCDLSRVQERSLVALGLDQTSYPNLFVTLTSLFQDCFWKDPFDDPLDFPIFISIISPASRNVRLLGLYPISFHAWLQLSTYSLALCHRKELTGFLPDLTGRGWPSIVLDCNQKYSNSPFSDPGDSMSIWYFVSLSSNITTIEQIRRLRRMQEKPPRPHSKETRLTTPSSFCICKTVGCVNPSWFISSSAVKKAV